MLIGSCFVLCLQFNIQVNLQCKILKLTLKIVSENTEKYNAKFALLLHKPLLSKTRFSLIILLNKVIIKTDVCICQLFFTIRCGSYWSWSSICYLSDVSRFVVIFCIYITFLSHRYWKVLKSLSTLWIYSLLLHGNLNS